MLVGLAWGISGLGLAAAAPSSLQAAELTPLQIFGFELRSQTHDAHAVAGRLNDRFTAAAPSNNLSEAGILVHMMDQDDDLKGWFAVNKRPWDPSARCDVPPFDNETWTNGYFTTSHTYCDRWSASLVTPRHPALFNDQMGVVLAPGPASHHLMCMYADDYYTRRFFCETPGRTAYCSPGCWNLNLCHCKAEAPASTVGVSTDTNRDLISFNGSVYLYGCDNPWNNDGSFSLDGEVCSYPPSQLKRVLQELGDVSEEEEASPYNELILSTRNPSWDESVVEALIVPSDVAEHVLSKTLQMHGLMRGEGRHVPLLFYNATSKAPFSAVV